MLPLLLSAPLPLLPSSLGGVDSEAGRFGADDDCPDVAVLLLCSPVLSLSFRAASFSGFVAGAAGVAAAAAAAGAAAGAAASFLELVSGRCVLLVVIRGGGRSGPDSAAAVICCWTAIIHANEK